MCKTFVVTNTNQPPAVICAHAFNVGLLYFGTGHVTAMAQAPGTLLITPAGCHLRAVGIQGEFRGNSVGIQALVGSTARTPSGLNGRTVSATGVQWLGSASALHFPCALPLQFLVASHLMKTSACERKNWYHETQEHYGGGRHRQKKWGGKTYRVSSPPQNNFLNTSSSCLIL